MSLTPGTRLGPYEIEAPLGAGGMGDVYRARDTRLHRDVAIKVLPAMFASDPERVRRFQQEAHAVAALSHPHICQIFDVGADYLVLEYLDGVPLRGPLPESEAVHFALQIADALTAAHRRGILHRDLKPSNILVTHGAGTAATTAAGSMSRDTRAEQPAIKLLDFGIAKLMTGGPDMTGTVDGAVLGTAGYMSPEQAQGKPLDARSDIFSFGAVLYELVSGRRAFDGGSTAEVLSAVLRDDPRSLPATTPALERVIRKCLEKDPGRRYQSIAEVASDLEAVRKVPAARRGHVSRRNAAAAGVLVLLLAATIAFYVRGRGTPPSVVPSSSPIQSLAVLPLENLSGAAAQEYFADGMTDALINELARLAALKVISRTSVMPYKGARKPLKEIAAELGVDGVIEGSVLQEGDRVRISVKLIDGATDRHVWSDSYQRELGSILALQNDVARAVAREIRVTLTPQDETRLASAGDVNRDAYDAYLRGTQYAAQGTDEGQRKSIEALEKAVQLDPGFAPAYARLAHMYATYYMGGGLEPRTYYPKARAAALRSLEIDDSVSDAHVVLAMVSLHYDWNWPEAARRFKTAIALNPSNAHAHERYGAYLQTLGRFDEAVAERQLAFNLDPLSPFRAADVGYPLYLAGKHDEAIRAFRSGLEMDSRFFWAHLWIGQVRIAQASYREAIADIERALDMSNRNTRILATLGNAYGLAGRTEEARRLLDELRNRASKEYVSAYYLALVYAGLGMRDRVFEHLDKAIEERQPYLALLNIEPPFHGLRADPQFQSLVRRIGIPDR
jgi:serine/threonine-protein kinase